MKWGSETHLGNGLHQCAAADDGGMGILRPYNIELSRTDREIIVGRSRIKSKISFDIKRSIALNREVGQTAYPADLLARKGEMDINVLAVHFEFLLLSTFQTGTDNVDVEIITVEGDTSERTLQKVVTAEILEKLVEAGMQGLITGSIVHMCEYHISVSKRNNDV